MTKNKIELHIPDETIVSKIYLFRGQKVMLDYDLADLYNVEVKQLKRQVRRNVERFSKDFFFQLTAKEFENLRSQIGTSSWGGKRKQKGYSNHIQGVETIIKSGSTKKKDDWVQQERR